MSNSKSLHGKSIFGAEFVTFMMTAVAIVVMHRVGLSSARDTICLLGLVYLIRKYLHRLNHFSGQPVANPSAQDPKTGSGHESGNEVAHNASVKNGATTENGVADGHLVSADPDALQRTSQELKMPISSITAISDALLDGGVGELNEQQKEFIGDIEENALRLNTMMDNVVDLLKAETGTIELSAQPVDVSELVQRCVSAVEMRAKDKNVNVNTQVDGPLCEVTADSSRLRQILINLLNAAIYFNKPGGDVVLRLRPERGERLRISVRDTGRGLKPEHLENLFDPRHQALVEGGGVEVVLGLAVTKQLIELHGGTIKLASVADAGNTITISLPLGQSADDESSATIETNAGT